MILLTRKAFGKQAGPFARLDRMLASDVNFGTPPMGKAPGRPFHRRTLTRSKTTSLWPTHFPPNNQRKLSLLTHIFLHSNPDFFNCTLLPFLPTPIYYHTYSSFFFVRKLSHFLSEQYPYH
jgi:hypothetical protein